MLTLPLLKEKCLNNYEALASPLRKEFTEPEIEQIYQTIRDLPSINVEIKLRGPLKDKHEVERIIKQPVNYKEWNDIHAGDEYTLMVNLHRLGQKTSNHIYCRFPKPKDEGWFLTLGRQENGELLALKRVAYRSNKSSHQLIFTAPNTPGRIIYTIYFISDGFIGLDQQFNVQLEVIENRDEKMFNENRYEK